MIEELKLYSDYQAAEIPWVGKIPSHWSTERVKWLFEKQSRPADADAETVTCFRDGMVTLRRNRRTTGFTEALKEIGYQGVRNGDLVVHAMDAFAGAVGVSDSNGKCTPVYAVCVPKLDANPHYYATIIREMARTHWILALAKGIRERSTDFRFADLGKQVVPIPPPDEQAAIVKFIDHADRRIRRYIRAKQKLIKLLEEQKQAIIHQAVTRGVDLNVRVKPSGVEWLGDMPEHWETRQVGRVVSFVTSGSRGWAKYYSDTGEVFLQSGNLGRTMALNLARIQRVTPAADGEGTRTRVQENDILVCITGALTGNTAIVGAELPGTAYVNQHVALVRPVPRLVQPRFLAYCLHSPIGQSQFKTSEYGGTKQGLGLDDVRQAWVPLPPSGEQDDVVEFLDRSLAQTRAGVEVAVSEIELLREYRTRLIADVVTGKLDVRQAAASLPDEVNGNDEPELDETEDDLDEDADLADEDTDA